MSFIDYIILVPLLAGFFCSALLYGYVLTALLHTKSIISKSLLNCRAISLSIANNCVSKELLNS